MEGKGLTVLGAQRANPYAVATMRQAYNNLYDPDISSLLPNHLYVRFLPQNPEDVGELLQTGLEFTDFPLDYEITHMGEYYQDSSVPDTMYTWMYAVVPHDFTFPNVPYEVLEQLALAPEDSQLAQEAFALTNNTYDAPDAYEAAPLLIDGRFKFTPNHDGGISESAGASGACNCALPDHTRKPSGCVTVYLGQNSYLA